jgi:hypothetical protein
LGCHGANDFGQHAAQSKKKKKKKKKKKERKERKIKLLLEVADPLHVCPI